MAAHWSPRMAKNAEIISHVGLIKVDIIIFIAICKIYLTTIAYKLLVIVAKLYSDSMKRQQLARGLQLAK